MPYLYDDEDNAPMNDDAFDGIHNPTVYGNRAEMRHFEQPLPFTDPPLPEKGCWNCNLMDWKHEACTVNWNNMDEDYYNPDTDDRKLDDYCENWELNPDASLEDFM